jgi:site-specific recombinase XerD
MKEKKLSGNLNGLRSELERRLIVLRYSKVATQKYLMIFGWVKDYLAGYGETAYTKEMGQRFLIESTLQSVHSPSQFKSARVTIRRLDEILENKPFTPCFRETKHECPPRFTASCDKYLESLAKRGCKEHTIVTRKRYAVRFLSRLPETVLTPETLSAADLYNAFTKHEWQLDGLITARSILSFLFESGVTKTNLSVCVPKPTRPRPLPSIYSGNEVKQLLSSVDRSSDSGKRDYAILLLASHLGLRSSDIVNLSFKDIDFTTKTIEIIQVKTARPLTLVMNSEVKEAITDYIQNARPQSSSDKIFLRSRAPFSPLTAGSGYAITRKCFNLAGIAAQGRRRGAHALRASYATALVAKGVPYAVVQEVLGHEDRESAKYYVRVDVRRLRMCALDVPKPTGAFAVMLEPEVRRTLVSGDLDGGR